MSMAQLSFNTPSETIDTLPTDKNVPNHAEIQIVDSLFKEQHTTIQKLLEGTKDVFIIGVLFLVISLPQSEGIIKRFFPSSENSIYIMLGIKCLLFMLAYFVVKNMYLVKK